MINCSLPVRKEVNTFKPGFLRGIMRSPGASTCSSRQPPCQPALHPHTAGRVGGGDAGLSGLA